MMFLLLQDLTADEEFRALLWRVVPVALVLFGAAALLLMFVVRGFGEADANKKTNLPARLILLCVGLVLIGLLIASRST